jgi:hypothetical protein
VSGYRCSLCGRVMTLREGSTTVGGATHYLCHPDEGFDCYRLVTVYHVPINGSGVFNRPLTRERLATAIRNLAKSTPEWRRNP